MLKSSTSAAEMGVSKTNSTNPATKTSSTTTFPKSVLKICKRSEFKKITKK